MIKWIDIGERSPTKEEREYGNILWWNSKEYRAYSGDYYSYDGKYIRVCGRHWSIDLPLSEFTHWAIIHEPTTILIKKGNKNEKNICIP